LLWSSSASNLADGVLRIALPLIAVKFTRSPAIIGALEMARSVPWLVLALPVGALTDRWDRRVAMLSASGLRVAAAVALAVALATDTGSLSVLFAAAVVAGVAEVVYDTAAQSILPAVVDRRLLGRANSRLAILERGTSEYLAPGVGGFLVGGSIVAAASAPALLWLFAALGLIALRGAYRPERSHEPTTLLTDIKHGVSFVWHRPVLRTLAGIVGVGNLTSSATFTVLVIYAVGPDSAMGLSDGAYGTMLLVGGIGAIAAAVVNERLVGRLGEARTIRWATPALMLFSLGPAISTDPLVVGALLIVSSFFLMTFNIPSVSYRQRVTPDAVLGRVNSTFRLVGWGTMPIGALLGGFLGEAFGVRAVFITMTSVASLLIVPAQLIRTERM
jgi:MFS family permease